MSPLHAPLYDAVQSSLALLDTAVKAYDEGVYDQTRKNTFNYDVLIFKKSKTGGVKTSVHNHAILQVMKPETIQKRYADHSAHQIFHKSNFAGLIEKKSKDMEKAWGKLLAKICQNPDLIAQDLWPCIRLQMKNGEFSITLTLQKGTKQAIACPEEYKANLPYYIYKDTTKMSLRDHGVFILQALDIIATHPREVSGDIYHFLFESMSQDNMFKSHPRNIHTMKAVNEKMAQIWIGATQNHAVLMDSQDYEVMKEIYFQPHFDKPSPLASWPEFPEPLPKGSPF